MRKRDEPRTVPACPRPRGRGVSVCWLVGVAALLVLVLVAAVGTGDAAASPSVAAAKARAQRLEQRIVKLSAELSAAAGRFEDLAQRVELLQQRLTEEGLELAAAQDSLAAAQRQLADRVVEIYKSRQPELLDVVFSSSSFQDLASQLDFYRHLNASDAALVADASQRTKELARRRDQLLRDRASAAELMTSAAREKERLSEAVSRQRRLLSSARSEVKQLVREQRRALAAARAARAAAAAALVGAPQLPAVDVPHGGDYTQRTWAETLLRSMQLPVTRENLRAIVAWEAAEGGHWFNTAHYNPLNTTMPAPGATAMNSVGVKAYVSWQQGLQATIATLRNGFYGGILAALRQGADAQAVANAVGASPWGTGTFSVAALAGF